MLQTLLSVVLPHGGQLQARRNAWAGMSDAAVRARAVREAEAALSAAGLAASEQDVEPVRAAR